MSLYKVDILTEKGDILTLNMRDSSNGYYVKNITGLDPGRAELVSSSFGTVDGAQYQAARRDPRNIVLTLGFSPDFVVNTVSSLRSVLYSMLMPKSKVIMTYYMDEGLVVKIDGRVESFDSNAFSKDPEASISIICFNPDFYSINSLSVSDTTRSTVVEKSILYNGNIATGFKLTLTLNTSATTFNLYLKSPDGTLNNMTFVGSLLNGDVLTISTVSGNKYARLKRSNIETSVLYGIDYSSVWLQFVPGTNYIRPYVEGNVMPYTIEYLEKYGGI